MMSGPTLRVLHAGNGRIVQHTDARHRMPMAVNGWLHIDNQTGIAAGRESVTMHTRPPGGCKLHIDRVVGQQNLIIAGPSTLLIVREPGTVTLVG